VCGYLCKNNSDLSQFGTHGNTLTGVLPHCATSHNAAVKITTVRKKILRRQREDGADARHTHRRSERASADRASVAPSLLGY
jgi:hypothetical protein